MSLRIPTAARALCAAMTIAVGVALTGAPVAAAAPAPAPAQADVPPVADDFFAAPDDLATLPKGEVIRERTVPVTLFGLFPVETHQLVYRSNDTNGEPIAAATTVLVPSGAPVGTRPLVSYQAATNALGPQCNPSRALPNQGINEEFQLALLLLHGWAVAVPDHEGPDLAYSAGRNAAHITLDGIRAVQSARTGGTAPGGPVALWGYSGGGFATAWTAELAGSYAEDLNIVGSAEGGVPVDFTTIARDSDGAPGFGLIFAAALGLDREFPDMDVDALLNEQGAALAAQFRTYCVKEIAHGAQGLSFDSLTTEPGAVGSEAVQEAIAANSLGQATPDMPVLLYHSVNDNLVPTASVVDLARQYCVGKATVQLQLSPFLDHVQVAIFSIGDVLTFLEDRFAGRAARSTC